MDKVFLVKRVIEDSDHLVVNHFLGNIQNNLTLNTAQPEHNKIT